MLKTLCSVLLLVSVTACSGNVRESLGLKKESPDEFMVIARPSLVVPPSFDLVEPGAITSSFDRNEVRDDAKQALVGKKRRSSGSVSKAESALLKRAGTSKIDPSIREKLQADAAPLIEAKKEEGFLSKLNPFSSDPVIDPDAEEQRIADDIKSGKPVTGDDVKTAKQGVGGIFN